MSLDRVYEGKLRKMDLASIEKLAYLYDSAVKAYMPGMELHWREHHQYVTMGGDVPMLTLIYRAYKGTGVSLGDYFQPDYYYRFDPLNESIQEACERFRRYLVYPADEGDIQQLRRLSFRALHPLEGVPGHAEGCPCHHCRTARRFVQSQTP